MDVGDLLQEVARNTNRNISAISANGGVDLVNAWMRDCTTRWPYMDTLETSAVITVSAATRVYNLSASLDKIYNMFIPAQSINIRKVTIDQMHSIAPSGSGTTGAPTIWAPFGERQVMFYPTPADSYDISYHFYENHVPVSATSNTIVSIDSKYHDSGVWYVTWRIAQRMGDMDTMALAKLEYDKTFEAMLADMVVRFGGHNRVRVAGELTSGRIGDDDKATRMFYG